MRMSISILHLCEFFVSSLVHLLFGVYIFSSALAGDISHYMNEYFIIFKKNVDFGFNKLEDTKLSGRAHDLPPIVLVHGIFGVGKERMGNFSYFCGAEKKDERVLVPDLGSLASVYDRARELFYYLKGGQVDYGEEHSTACGHSQFGRTYKQAHYTEWDEDHPIHFVGHSAGAQVVRVLQQLLADKAFKGYENTSENWVLSLTSISGALNGSTRTYIDGIEPEDGRTVRPISLIQLFQLGVIFYEWLDIGWLQSYYNFGFSHFNISWRKIGISGLVNCVMGNMGPFASDDWIIPDLALQGSIKMNRNLHTFPNTYYFSYATKMTMNIKGITLPSSVHRIHPLLLLRVLQMSQWRHPQGLKPPFNGYRDEDWWDNDGALSTNSMTHPRFPIEHPNQLVTKDFHYDSILPGIWYHKIVEGDHILFVFNRERAGVQFDLLYDSIFERCRKHFFRKKSSLLYKKLTAQWRN